MGFEDDIKNPSKLQEKIGYFFCDKGLIEQALTHSSYANENREKKHSDNERLEFLGDAVLELVSSELLFSHYPDRAEGELSRHRAALVCEQALAFCARKLGLGEYIRLGKGEEHGGGRERKSILSDALEALIGAIYLDGGYKAARKFAHEFVLGDMEGMRLFSDSKTALQELVQGSGSGAIIYRILDESGPAHKKHYVSEVSIGEKSMGRGEGDSKRDAEQAAAYRALKALLGENGSQM